MKKTQADYWAPRINAEWRKSIEGILGVGRQLIAAKEVCEHGEFLRLFKGSVNAVSEPLPFGADAAQQLMKVASNAVISNTEFVRHLPQSWGTLYELTKLAEEQIVAGIKAGEITPDMTRSQAAAMRADPIERIDSPVHELMADKVENAAMKFIGQLTTPVQFAYVLSRLDQLSRFISDKQTETGASSNAEPVVGIESVAVELCSAMSAAVRAECVDAGYAERLHQHWLELAETLFDDCPLCRVRAPWCEARTGDAIRDAAAFAAGVQGRPAKVFRQLNVVARRIDRLIQPHTASKCSSRGATSERGRHRGTTSCA